VVKNVMENACCFSPLLQCTYKWKSQNIPHTFFTGNHGEKLEILRFKFFSGKFESLPFKFSTPKFISFSGENIDEKLEFWFRARVPKWTVHYSVLVQWLCWCLVQVWDLQYSHPPDWELELSSCETSSYNL
jgi:hypothetical protein